jgi:hypothetical protein
MVVSMDANEDGVPVPPGGESMPPLRREPTKGEWIGGGNHSDDEVLVAPGPSGSAALDERTSAAARASLSRANAGLPPTMAMASAVSVGVPVVTSGGSGSGAVRPVDEGDGEGEGEGDDDDVPSPAPTLLTLRHALQSTAGRTAAGDTSHTNTNTNTSDHDEPNTPTGEVISFAEWLLESRLPDAPPLGIESGRGVRRRGVSVGSAAGGPPPVVPPPSGNTVSGAALVTRYPLSRGYDLYGTRGDGGADTELEPEMERTNRAAREGTVDHDAMDTENGSAARQASRLAPRGGSLRAAGKRTSRRWSVLDGILHPGSGSNSVNPAAPIQPSQLPPPAPSSLQTIGSSASQPQISQPGTRPSFRRHRSTQSQSALSLSTETHPLAPQSPANVVSDSEAGYGEPAIARTPTGTQEPSSSGPPSASRSHHSRLSRFFHLKASKSRSRPGFHLEGGVLHALDSSLGGAGALAQEYERRAAQAVSAMAPAAPAPKLEYIKLPGTKGAIMVKAVETSRKRYERLVRRV